MKYIYVCLIILFASCSSAPKRPAEINNIRRIAEQELSLGNSAVGQGQYENALLFYNEAHRKAVSVDDSSLIIRTLLARGNVFLTMGNADSAFSDWDNAIKEAEKFKNQELLSVAKVFSARGLLLSEIESPSIVLNIINTEMPNIKNDRYYIAFSHQTRGLALRAMRSYNEAENAIRRSLEIHEKERFLENASFDWYIIASIRSLNGNFAGAISALEASMAIDRRIENSHGLASSWKAMGDVFTRMGRADDARLAYARSESILNAIN